MGERLYNIFTVPLSAENNLPFKNPPAMWVQVFHYIPAACPSYKGLFLGKKTTWTIFLTNLTSETLNTGQTYTGEVVKVPTDAGHSDHCFTINFS